VLIQPARGQAEDQAIALEKRYWDNYAKQIPGLETNVARAKFQNDQQIQSCEKARFDY